MGRGFALELFRFGLVARLDNTSACTEGATTERFSRFVKSLMFCCILAPDSGEIQKTNTSCMLNNPLSQPSSLITNYS